MKHEWTKTTPDHDVEFASGDWHLIIQKDGNVYFTNYKLMTTPNGYAKGKAEAVKRFIESCDTFAKALAEHRATKRKYRQPAERGEFTESYCFVEGKKGGNIKGV